MLVASVGLFHQSLQWFCIFGENCQLLDRKKHLEPPAMRRLLGLPQCDFSFKDKIRQNDWKCFVARVNGWRSTFISHPGAISLHVHWACEIHFQCSTYAKFDVENYCLLCIRTAVSGFLTMCKCSQSIPIHLNQMRLCFNKSLLPKLKI